MMHRHTNKFLEGKNIALVALVAISAFALLYTPVRAILTQAVYSVAPGVWGAGDSAKNYFTSLATNFKDKDNLVKENEMLSEAISLMEAKVLDRNLLAEKVTKLEEALGRVRGDDRVVASVLVGAGRSPYDTLVIDAGTDESVNVGDMVAYAGSGIIGEIVESNQSSSKVKLFSSPGEERVVVVGTHYMPVLAVGRGMGNFEAKVPQDSLVVVGDNVVSAKGGLIIGKIYLVEEKQAEPFKRIFFRVPFNITEIQSVEVIVSKRL